MRVDRTGCRHRKNAVPPPFPLLFSFFLFLSLSFFLYLFSFGFLLPLRSFLLSAILDIIRDDLWSDWVLPSFLRFFLQSSLFPILFFRFFFHSFMSWSEITWFYDGLWVLPSFTGFFFVLLFFFALSFFLPIFLSFVRHNIWNDMVLGCVMGFT